MKTVDFLFRIRLIVFLVILFGVTLTSRLFFVQIINGQEFLERTDRQYVRPSSFIFTRGSIFFTEKDENYVSAASLKPVFIVAINPSVITDPEIVFNKIINIYKVDRDDFFRKASKTKDPYEILFTTEDKTIADAITEEHIKGVIITKNNLRFYPGEVLASHVLGIVAKTEESGDFSSGRYGIEKYYNDILSRNEESLFVNFFAEIFSDLKKIASGGSNKVGDIYLTIEPTTQGFLEETLRVLHDNWNSRLTGGVIIDPKSGKILAMANLPSFDPGDFSQERDVSVFANPLVESVFEMGSIFKPLTIAAGLDSDKITADTKYKDDGSIVISGKTISNFDKKGRGLVNMQKVLDDSLNTGAVFVAQEMGLDLFTSYIKSFGFDELTGISLPNEVGGLTKNINSKYDIDRATISFGQGIAVTPISMVRALSSLANDGFMIKPLIVNKIKFSNGTEQVFKTENVSKVFKKETAQEVSRMLASAYDNVLLSGTLKLEEYTVSAKTGTAQMASENGGYDPDKLLHSFFGYFPSYNPKFLIFLYTIEPKGLGSDFAARTLAVPFSDIVKFLINYYQIPPDR